ncbi:beta-glucoside-specific PTS transporter subunit IIABC [Mesobacillus foraminis]|uniref:PTS system beta-glucosides-specific IIC component n=1 Tax=Mesobacillus foraminis TaxID=279826 RepID=A0A4R2BN90_9BACI|nr:beta-glucoside-specific PTS transporter subunit IIABC [Mesobacillus foraminis]TCN27474.1 PTS system beta-glucosides-specific IIC component [Mesobacillus foraminis]
MSHQKTAEQILELVGGEKNIQHVIHCITRLRFNLHDQSLAKQNKAKIEAIKGVMGVNVSGDQFQVIIGNDVPKVYEELTKIAHISSGSGGNGEKKKVNVISSIFDVISGSFTPLLPAIAGAGMIKGILAILAALNWVSPESQAYIILNAIGDGAFYFLPILLALSVAKKFGSNIYVAGAIATSLLHPTMTALLGAGEPVEFLGLPVTAVTYSSTVIPILLAIWLTTYVEKAFDRIIPSMLKLIFVPTFTLLVMVPVTLIAIGPLGTILGNWLSIGVDFLFEHTGILAGLLLGGTFSLIIMTGMHYALTPIIVNNLATKGYDMLIPHMLVANMGQAGAAFAVALRSKNRSFKSIAMSTSITALMGVTEPAMYGVNMRLKKPFIGALIGGAVGGAYFSAVGVKYFILGGNVGLPGLASFIGDTFFLALLGVPIAFIAGALATFLLGFDDIEEEETSEETVTKTELNKEVLSVTQEELVSPLKGQVVELKDVSDAVFSSEAMGKGLAIIPSEGKVVAPANGVITTLFATKHAIGIKTDNGAEVLIHVGIDTVQLDGKHFTSHIEQDATVKAGELLVEFDIEAIKEAGYEVVTPIIVTNTPDYTDITALKKDHVDRNEKLLAIS